MLLENNKDSESSSTSKNYSNNYHRDSSTKNDEEKCPDDNSSYENDRKAERSESSVLDLDIVLDISYREHLVITRNEIVRLSPFAECSETIKLGGIILIIVEFFVEAGNAVSYVDTAARVILSVHNMDNGTGLSLTLHVFSDKKLSVYRFIYI